MKETGIPCIANQIRLPSGKCQDCGPYTKPQNNQECRADPCSPTEVTQIDGTCKKCPSFSRSEADGRRCGTSSCLARQIILADGSCEDCADYSVPVADKRSCTKVSCNSSLSELRVTKDGKCTRCETFTRLA